MLSAGSRPNGMPFVSNWRTCKEQPYTGDHANHEQHDADEERTVDEPLMLYLRETIELHLPDPPNRFPLDLQLVESPDPGRNGTEGQECEECKRQERPWE